MVTRFSSINKDGAPVEVNTRLPFVKLHFGNNTGGDSLFIVGEIFQDTLGAHWRSLFPEAPINPFPSHKKIPMHI